MASFVETKILPKDSIRLISLLNGELLLKEFLLNLPIIHLFPLDVSSQLVHRVFLNKYFLSFDNGSRVLKGDKDVIDVSYRYLFLAFVNF